MTDQQAAPMPVVSGVCTCKRCEDGPSTVYRMIGRCYNCKTEPILMVFRTAFSVGVLQCPVCGCSDVHSVRPATADEVPAELSNGEGASSLPPFVPDPRLTHRGGL